MKIHKQFMNAYAIHFTVDNNELNSSSAQKDGENHRKKSIKEPFQRKRKIVMLR